MGGKRLAVFDKWADILKNAPTIEDMEVAGANRHRRECFEITKKLTQLHHPSSEEEFASFMAEYVRQLMGPEIFDAYNTPREGQDISQMFRIIRKYTLGV